MIKVSDELLQDSVFDIESYIATEFARRVGEMPGVEAAEGRAWLVFDPDDEDAPAAQAVRDAIREAGMRLCDERQSGGELAFEVAAG